MKCGHKTPVLKRDNWPRPFSEYVQSMVPFTAPPTDLRSFAADQSRSSATERLRRPRPLSSSNAFNELNFSESRRGQYERFSTSDGVKTQNIGLDKDIWQKKVAFVLYWLILIFETIAAIIIIVTRNKALDKRRPPPISSFPHTLWVTPQNNTPNNWNTFIDFVCQCVLLIL